MNKPKDYQDYFIRANEETVFNTYSIQIYNPRSTHTDLETKTNVEVLIKNVRDHLLK